MRKKNQNILMSDDWGIKPPSQEYLNLKPEIKQTIIKFTDEHPVKLGAIAKSLGIKVLLSTLPRGISGQIGQEDSEFVIRINRHEAKHRQRFTLAHEIAHYLLHRNKIVDSGGWSENVLLRSGQSDEIEYEANRLASDLVIPSHQLTEATAKYSGPLTNEVIEDLARRFGVSTTSMEIKLQVT